MVTINFIYKWEKVNTIFMDLSKMFDTLIRNLLLAKLNAHGVFFFSAIKLVQIYLSEHFHRVNLNNNFIKWQMV